MPGGLAPAGLAEAAPRQAGPAAPALVVRTRREDHTLHGGTTYRIGRDPASDIAVADSRVSWRHGVLQVEGGRWVLEDVGSTNGTFVGLERVQRVAIASDCVVRLGNPEDGPVLRCMPQTAAPGARGAGALRERSAPAGAPAPATCPTRDSPRLRRVRRRSSSMHVWRAMAKSHVRTDASPR